MELAILQHFDDEGIINKEVYISQHKDDFENLEKLEKYKIDTALFIFDKSMPDILKGKIEHVYYYKNGSNINDVYLYDNKFLVAFSPLGGSSAAGIMEELGFFGITKFYACGSAGLINHEIDGSKFLLVEKAIRDEGASFHYLEPSLYAETDKELTAELAKYLEENSFGYLKGTTWTTDSFFRETPKTIEKRLEQGATCVEMECAGWCAVAKFRKYKFAQLLYFSDAVKQEGWHWKSDKKNLKSAVLSLMLDFVSKFVENNKK